MADAPNPTGTNTPQTTAKEVKKLMEPGEPYSTQDIQDALDLPQSTANYRLNKLADEGAIRKKKLGKRTVVWMLTEDDDE